MNTFLSAISVAIWIRYFRLQIRIKWPDESPSSTFQANPINFRIVNRHIGWANYEFWNPDSGFIFREPKNFKFQSVTFLVPIVSSELRLFRGNRHFKILFTYSARYIYETMIIYPHNIINSYSYLTHT